MSVQIDATQPRSISPYLASLSLVYVWAADAMYGVNESIGSNDTWSEWACTNNVGTMRYPGGTASYHNWEDPSGLMGETTHDPSFDEHHERVDGSQWMSLAEYLDLCDRIPGVVPLIGINYNDHGERYTNESASIAKAERLVQYVVSRGYTGVFCEAARPKLINKLTRRLVRSSVKPRCSLHPAHLTASSTLAAVDYIGNEDAVTSDDNHPRWKAHVAAVKAVDPSCKTIFNQNGLGSSGLQRFLDNVGTLDDGNTVVDVAEFHGKWPFGGAPSSIDAKGECPCAFTTSEWLNEVPLVEHKTGKTWRDRQAEVRAKADSMGRPDLLIANNEFGLGKSANLADFNRFTKSLVNVELAMEMFIAGFDMAVFWDNAASGMDDKKLTTASEGYRFNPVEMGLRWLFAAAGTTYLPLSSSNARVHGFAAVTDATPFLRVYLINKMEEEQEVTIVLDADGSLPALESGVAMVDTADHWGEAQLLSVVCGTATPFACTVALPAISFASLQAAPQPTSSDVSAVVSLSADVVSTSQALMIDLEPDVRTTLLTLLIFLLVCGSGICFFALRNRRKIDNRLEERIQSSRRLRRIEEKVQRIEQRFIKRRVPNVVPAMSVAVQSSSEILDASMSAAVVTSP